MGSDISLLGTIKIKRILYLLLVIIFFFSACSPHEENDTQKVITTFYDIPDITDDEIKELEALLAANDHFIYGMIPGIEAFVDVNGEIGGFAAYFTDWLSEFFGVPFIVEHYQWNELITGLDSFAIDFTGELTSTEERISKYYMTTPIAERIIEIYTHVAPAHTTGKTPVYAFYTGSSTIDDVTAHIEGDYGLLFVNNFDQAHDALADGTADAFFTEGSNFTEYHNYDDIIGKYFFPPIFSPVSFSTQNPEFSPIISAVQKAFSVNGIDLADIYSAGKNDFTRNKVLDSLTPKERDFIRDNPVIYYVTQYRNYPMSFYNENDGQWQGIAFELLDRIEDLTGLVFERAHGDEFISWPNLLQMVETGEASFVTELIRTEERIGQYLFPETTIASEYLTLASTTDLRSIELNEVYDMRVGVVRNTAQTQNFMRWFPNHEYIEEYDDTNEGFLAMRRGAVDLFMTSTSNLLIMTNYLELTGFKANYLFDDTIQEATYGLNINEEILVSILDKALAVIDHKAITDDWRGRSFDYRYQLIEAQRPWLIGAIALTLIILILLAVLLTISRGAGRRLERTVQERTEELIQASQSKSAFLATMSHEIRTPMNSIMGFAELARDMETNPKIRDYMVKIYDSARLLLNIINDILDISKVESGKMTLSRKPFDLSEVFAMCESVIMPVINEKGLTLDISVAPIKKQIIGDPVRLYQVLSNFLSNAVKFTDTGSITLTCYVLNETETDISLCFEIKDTGIGIDSDHLDKVFDPFIQADSGTTRQYDGTGLGLSITKNIIELMGGTLQLESSKGLGSTFSFRLTFETTDKTSVDTVKEIISRPMFSGLVLICDDNVMNRQLAREHLRIVGLETHLAENGEIAVRMVNEHAARGQSYDLIFMDIFMPIKNGLEAAEEIIKAGVKTPIVAMTANIMPNDLENYRNIGMNDCIGKPFTSEELWRVLLKYIEPKPQEADSKNEKIEGDIAYQTSLKISFLNINRDKYKELSDEINASNLKTAHRLAHTLKSNAGMVGKTDLQRTAAEIESLLKNGESIPAGTMSRLKTELDEVLREFAPLALR